VSKRILIAVACLAFISRAAVAGEAELPPDVARAVSAGIGYLVRSQNQDGSWLSDGATGLYPTAITSLAGLALLSEGNTCYSGPHAQNVRRAVEYLLRQGDPKTGLIGGYEGGRPMFGHGFAMLFLAQVYGAEGEEDLHRRIGDVLTRAIALTASSQSKLGGWYYTPGSPEDEGAVTVTQMQGLRACSNAGLPVPATTVEGAMDYIRKAANPDGGIAYRAGVPGESRPGITAAAVDVMYAAGVYKGYLVTGALAYAQKNVPTRPPSTSGGNHYYYSQLYMAQVMHFQAGDAWRDYYKSLSGFLLEAQRPDGAWSGDFIGAAYGTSVALIVLQLPLNNVPAFQR
jgi:hypothetical protein